MKKKKICRKNEEIWGKNWTPLEKVESIDMLRIIDNGYSLGVEVVDSNIMNIDIPEDVELVNELLKKDKLFKQYEKQ